MTLRGKKSFHSKLVPGQGPKTHLTVLVPLAYLFLEEDAPHQHPTVKEALECETCREIVQRKLNLK